MATGTFDFTALSTSRSFALPDANGTILLTPGASGITTLGTIVTGVWHGTIIGVTYGGTGADLSGTGAAHHVLKQSSPGAVVTVGQLALADLSDAATISVLPVYAAKTADFTVDSTAHGYKVTTSTTAVATLPAASATSKLPFIIQASGTGVVTVIPSGTDKINGWDSTIPLVVPSTQAVWLYSNGVDGYSASLTTQGLGPNRYIPVTGDTVFYGIGGQQLVQNILVDPAGTLATFSQGFSDGVVGGQIVYVTYSQIVTLLTMIGSNYGTGGLAKPTVAAVGSCFGWVWDDGTNSGNAAGWIRFQ